MTTDTYNNLLIKVAMAMLDEQDEMMEKEAGIKGVRSGHKLRLKNTARAAAATPSAISKLREQGLIGTTKGLPNGTPLLLPAAPGAEPTDTGLARSSLTLLGLGPSKPGKGRSLSKKRQFVENPSRTTKKVIKENKDTLIPSAKTKDGSKGAFNRDFMGDLRGKVDAAQEANHVKSTALVPVPQHEQPGRGLGWLWKLLGVGGAGGAAAGTVAALTGGSEAAPAAATGLSALLRNPGAVAGAAGLAGTAGTLALLNSLPATRKRKALNAMLAIAAGAGTSYAGWKAAGGPTPAMSQTA